MQTNTSKQKIQNKNKTLKCCSYTNQKTWGSFRNFLLLLNFVIVLLEFHELNTCNVDIIKLRLLAPSVIAYLNFFLSLFD